MTKQLPDTKTISLVRVKKVRKNFTVVIILNSSSFVLATYVNINGNTTTMIK